MLHLYEVASKIDRSFQFHFSSKPEMFKNLVLVKFYFLNVPQNVMKSGKKLVVWIYTICRIFNVNETIKMC